MNPHIIKYLKESVAEARCPECGAGVFLPTSYNPDITIDPIVFCSDRSHWSGNLSKCKVAPPSAKENEGRETNSFVKLMRLAVAAARCPECGDNIFIPSVIKMGMTEDPIVWCRDMGHWTGNLSECKIAKADCYVAVKSCGCIIGAVRDDPDCLEQVSARVAEFIVDGYTIKRARYCDIADRIGR